MLTLGRIEEATEMINVSDVFFSVRRPQILKVPQGEASLRESSEAWRGGTVA